MPFQITEPYEVAALPDGTLITWQPVPGDATSAAVAFVHHHDTERDGDQGAGTLVKTWISPGNGWEPEGIDVLTYPVTVIGDLNSAQSSWFTPVWPEQAPLEPPLLAPQFETLTVGGTYPRDVALQAACSLFAGQDRHWVPGSGLIDVDDVISVADQFEVWLTPPALAEDADGVTDAISTDAVVADRSASDQIDPWSLPEAGRG